MDTFPVSLTSEAFIYFSVVLCVPPMCGAGASLLKSPCLLPLPMLIGVVFASDVLVKWFKNCSPPSSLEDKVAPGPGTGYLMQTVGIIPCKDLLLFGN